MLRKSFLSLAACLLVLPCAMAAPAGTVYLEDMTTTELAAALREGHTTVIIPVGGTEQSGPHMALGKHNVRVRALAGRIAQQLGNAVVAPVVAYVPEGAITPPTEHMRFVGTISIPEATFKSLLDATARGMRQHGFRDVVLLGDHGGYQSALKAVAVGLNREWASSKTRAHFVGEYYQATQTRYVQALKAKGLSDALIGIHAGSADTSLMMAIDPSLVRPELFAQAAAEGRSDGTNGDPRASSAALGQLGVDAVVQQSVAAIRKAVAAAR